MYIYICIYVCIYICIYTYVDVYVIEYGGFLKYGYPKPLFLFIGNNLFSMILGYPHLWKPPSFYPGVFHWLVADEGWLLDHSFHILFFLEAAAADRHFGYLFGPM